MVASPNMDRNGDPLHNDNHSAEHDRKEELRQRKQPDDILKAVLKANAKIDETLEVDGDTFYQKSRREVSIFFNLVQQKFEKMISKSILDQIYVIILIRKSPKLR